MPRKTSKKLSQYVCARMAEKDPTTAKQEREALIDGSKFLEDGAVVMALGGGKSKKDSTSADEKERMPITDRTHDDRGLGIVIGVASNAPQRRLQPPHTEGVRKRKVR